MELGAVEGSPQDPRPKGQTAPFPGHRGTAQQGREGSQHGKGGHEQADRSGDDEHSGFRQGFPDQIPSAEEQRDARRRENQPEVHAAEDAEPQKQAGPGGRSQGPRRSGPIRERTSPGADDQQRPPRPAEKVSGEGPPLELAEKVETRIAGDDESHDDCDIVPKDSPRPEHGQEQGDEAGGQSREAYHPRAGARQRQRGNQELALEGAEVDRVAEWEGSTEDEA